MLSKAKEQEAAKAKRNLTRGIRPDTYLIDLRKSEAAVSETDHKQNLGEPNLSQSAAKPRTNLGQTSDNPKTEPRTNIGQSSDNPRTILGQT